MERGEAYVSIFIYNDAVGRPLLMGETKLIITHYYLKPWAKYISQTQQKYQRLRVPSNKYNEDFYAGMFKNKIGLQHYSRDALQ